MPLLRKAENNLLFFWCPGCEGYHAVRVAGKPPVWYWNGSFDSPTFTPSILVNGTAHLENPAMPRCHMYVKNGKIQFLNDCSHKLAGQTVDMVPDPNGD